MSLANCEWATVELFDQMVRTKSGGEMAAYWSRPVIINEEKLRERLGDEFVLWRQAFLRSTPPRPSVPDRSVFGWFKTPWRNYWLKRWGINPENLSEMQFMKCGEKHLWMYDAVSLRQLLEQQGFEAVAQTDAFNSRIPYWKKYQMLDVEAGAVRKPDSLFMEAMKPAAPFNITDNL